MQSDNYESRTYAILLFKSLVNVADPMQIISLTESLFCQLVEALRDQLSHKASKAAMQVLITVCPLGRNRIKAANAGAVSVIVDLLLDHTIEKRFCEMALTVLDQLCQCAEGRAELVRHGAGMAVVSKKILRVSRVASDRGVRILLSVAKYSGSNQSVVQEMLQLGVVGKLCLVLQVDCGSKTKEKASEILKLHARAWKTSTCLPPNLITSYPA